eukprot:g14792.t1
MNLLPGHVSLDKPLFAFESAQLPLRLFTEPYTKKKKLLPLLVMQARLAVSQFVLMGLFPIHQVPGNNMTDLLEDSQGLHTAAVRFSYFQVCVNSAMLAVCVPLWCRNCKIFPINGRPLILYGFMAAVMFVAHVLGHINVLANGAIPCAWMVLLYSLTQNLTVATLFFEAWVLHYRFEFSAEMDAIRASMLTSKKDKTVKPLSDWYQRHRAWAYVSAFWVYDGVICSLVLVVWGLMLGTFPEIMHEQGKCKPSNYMWGFSILFVQALGILYFGKKIRKKGRDNYGIKRELTLMGVIAVVLLSFFGLFLLIDIRLMFEYSVQYMVFYCGYFWVIWLGFVEPVAQALRFKYSVSAKSMAKQAETISLEIILKNTIPTFTAAYLDFLAKEFSTENYLFYNAIARIERMAKPLQRHQSIRDSETGPSAADETGPSAANQVAEEGKQKEERVESFIKTETGSPRKPEMRNVVQVDVEAAVLEAYDLYISPAGSRQVNIPHHLRSEITTCVTALQKTSALSALLNTLNIILAAQVNIYTLMHTDSFQRFRHTLTPERINELSHQALKSQGSRGHESQGSRGHESQGSHGTSQMTSTISAGELDDDELSQASPRSPKSRSPRTPNNNKKKSHHKPHHLFSAKVKDPAGVEVLGSAKEVARTDAQKLKEMGLLASAEERDFISQLTNPTSLNRPANRPSNRGSKSSKKHERKQSSPKNGDLDPPPPDPGLDVELEIIATPLKRESSPKAEPFL